MEQNASRIAEILLGLEDVNLIGVRNERNVQGVAEYL